MAAIVGGTGAEGSCEPSQVANRSAVSVHARCKRCVFVRKKLVDLVSQFHRGQGSRRHRRGTGGAPRAPSYPPAKDPASVCAPESRPRSGDAPRLRVHLEHAHVGHQHDLALQLAFILREVFRTVRKSVDNVGGNRAVSRRSPCQRKADEGA
jgi:hypothetical protein